MVYCNLVVENGLEPLVIQNLREHVLTSGHPATKFIGNGCFMGAPLINEGEIIGTLCAFYIKPHVFKEYDLILIKSLAALMSHTIILEKGIISDPLSGLYNRHFIYNYFDYHKVKTNMKWPFFTSILIILNFSMIPLVMILVTMLLKRQRNVFCNPSLKVVMWLESVVMNSLYYYIHLIVRI
nr:GAF domain-containing protein [Peribacillus sp. V2I11]